MAISVYVAGVDRTDKVWANTQIRYEDQLNGRSTLSLTFEDAVDGFRPEDGAEILLLDGADRVFGGMLMEPEEALQLGTNRLLFNCQASDFSGLCDRALVAAAYTEQTLGAIVLDIMAQNMAGEGVGTSGVETGPTIKKAIFNWVSVTQAFNQLSELTGYAWWIDENKVLNFRERSSVAAPVELNVDTAGTVRVRTDRQKYRNYQVLRGGQGLTDPRAETFVGDGERRTFNVSFKVGVVPTITKNAAPQTVGIKGVETGKQWYWNKGATEISQDDSGTVLTGSDVLEVTYQGLYPLIVASARGLEIMARQAVEGGTGRYPQVEERTNIETVDAAIQATEALLDRYATIGRVLQCQTREVGLRPGQLVTCDFPSHEVNDETFLIESVTGANPPGLDDEFWYEIRALSGDPFGGWQEYFRRLQGRGQFVIGENESVVGLSALSDATEASDSISSSDDVPESRVDVARVGFSAVRAA